MWEGPPEKGKFDSPLHSITMILVELYRISRSPFSGEGEVMRSYAQIVGTLTKMNLLSMKSPKLSLHKVKRKTIEFP